MWVFTKRGFFSAVAHRECADVVHVRSRWREDIGGLKMMFEEDASASGACPLYVVQESLDADYPFRMNVTKQDWISYLTQEVQEMDYDNYKNAVWVHGATDDRLDRYHGVWDVMRGE